VLPGYVLVNMDLNDEAWTVVKNTPGVTGFVGAGAAVRSRRVRSTGSCTQCRPPARPRSQVEFTLGESVKVTSGPLSDFDGGSST
jgi:transcriptional antiterminator NusG